MDPKKIDTKSLIVSIRSTEKVLFDGAAQSVTSHNEQGEFDVLPLHAHFITIVQKKIIIHLEGGQKQEFDIDTGVMRVVDNIIEVFLGIETLDQAPAAAS